MFAGGALRFYQSITWEESDWISNAKYILNVLCKHFLLFSISHAPILSLCHFQGFEVYRKVYGKSTTCCGIILTSNLEGSNRFIGHLQTSALVLNHFFASPTDFACCIYHSALNNWFHFENRRTTWEFQYVTVKSKHYATFGECFSKSRMFSNIFSGFLLKTFSFTA